MRRITQRPIRPRGAVPVASPPAPARRARATDATLHGVLGEDGPAARCPLPARGTASPRSPLGHPLRDAGRFGFRRRVRRPEATADSAGRRSRAEAEAPARRVPRAKTMKKKRVMDVAMALPPQSSLWLSTNVENVREKPPGRRAMGNACGSGARELIAESSVVGDVPSRAGSRACGAGRT